MTTTTYSYLGIGIAILCFIVPSWQLLFNKQQKRLKRITSLGWVLLIVSILIGLVSYGNTKATITEKTEAEHKADSIRIADKNEILDTIQNALKPFKLRYNDTTKTVYSTLPTTIVKNNNVDFLKQQNKNGSNQANVQKVDSGSSALQSNATNYGNQAGRDININSERQLNETDKQWISNEMDKVSNQKGLGALCVQLFILSTSNAQKFASQLSDFLQQNGFSVITIPYFSFPRKGITVDINEGECYKIIIGTM